MGVTTSLSDREMKAQMPDAVYKQIGIISIKDLFSLQRHSTDTLHGTQGDEDKALLTQVCLMDETSDLVQLQKTSLV